MKSTLAGLRTLTLPWGQPESLPALVLGPDIPDRIAVDPYGNAVLAAMVWRTGLTVRHFQALAGGEYSTRLWSGCWDESAAAGPADVLWHTEQRAFPTGGAPLEFQQSYGDYAATGATPRRVAHFFGALVDVTCLAPVNIRTDTTDATYGDWTIDGRSMGRGGAQGMAAAADSAALPLAETVSDSFAVRWAAGRAYRLDLYGRLKGNAIGYGTFRLRRTNLAGPVLHTVGTSYIPSAGLALGVPLSTTFYLRNAGAAAINDTIVVTGHSNGAAATVTWVGSAESPRGIVITDCGSAGDFAGFAGNL